MCWVAIVVYHLEQPYSSVAFQDLLVHLDPKYCWVVDLSYLGHNFQDPSVPSLVLGEDSFLDSLGSFLVDLAW